MRLTSTRALALALLLGACTQPDTQPSAPVRSPTRPQAVLGPADATVVMRGLNNPRGLAFGPDGALFVAEAGRGGSGPCFQSGQVVCYGPTGAIGRLVGETQDTVVSGLPSIATGVGRAEGPNSIALLGMGGAYVTVGWENDPRLRAQYPVLAGFARLVRVFPTALVPRPAHVPTSLAEWEFVANPGNYEIAVNPDCGRIDDNPFGVLVAPAGVLVVDAGANAIVKLDATGELSTFAAFPSRYSEPTGPACPALPAGYPTTLPTETVPTSIAVGPDGAYYVGHLAGFPVVAGAANVYRVVAGATPEVFLTGFTFIVSLAFDATGNLYVLQHLDGPGINTGSLVRVAMDGTRTTVITGLTRPTGLAIGSDGAIYLSHRGISVGTGEVLRLRP
ncbi:MAG: ScyD/ScyE family protein [Gemmatimonadaceae bacterium]